MKRLILIIALLLPVSVSAGGLMMSSGTVAAAGDCSGTFGNDNQNATAAASNSRILCAALDAPSCNATVDTIELYSANTVSTQDVTVGLYSDSGGVPDALIGAELESADVGTWSAGWKGFATGGLAVTGGTNYWVCMNVSTNSAITLYYQNDVGGTNRYYDVHGYGNPWPATYTNDSSSSAAYTFRAVYR